MKVLVIGGMHGNEPLGLQVVELLRARKNSRVHTLLANERAIKQNVRFTEADLNRSFPGDATGKSYEARRAAEIMQLCSPYDVVLDFHNTHCPNNDCAFVGSTAAPYLFDVSTWLGLRRVIVADYDCVNKYAPNCVSIEISLTSKRMDTTHWVDAIEELAYTPVLPSAKNIDKYRFVYRMSLEDRDRLGLDKQGLRTFEPIKTGLARELGVATPAYPIFIADAYTPYNFGGLLNRLDV